MFLISSLRAVALVQSRATIPYSLLNIIQYRARSVRPVVNVSSETESIPRSRYLGDELTGHHAIWLRQPCEHALLEEDNRLIVLAAANAQSLTFPEIGQPIR